MEKKFSHIASLIGDPVRSRIMWALLDGRSYTATELAIHSDTSLPNISMHLNKLVTANILSVKKQGRHRYFNYSRPEVSYAVEALAGLMTTNTIKDQDLPEEVPVRFCRTCYDHLAGRVGVSVAESLARKKYTVVSEQNITITPKGNVFFQSLDIDIVKLQHEKRAFARTCLDWSERKDHIGGALGSAMLSRFLAKDWIRRTKNSRAVIVTAKGRKGFLDGLGLDL
jgi:DNA-binding transcriptional ArsR family regulator